MRYRGKGRIVLLAILMLLCSIIWSALAHSKDIPEDILTIEIVFDKSSYNLSRSDEPVTFNGWVNYTGVSVIPFTIHLEAYSDLGDVFLSQNDFTFRLPDSIPFDGVNPIDDGYNSQATPVLTISGYVEEGGIRTSIAPSSWIIPVYYYYEEEDLNETNEQKEQDFNLFLVSIPGYLLISLIFVFLISWKIGKEKKNI